MGFQNLQILKNLKTMTFSEYVIEEINDQEFYEDIEFDDTSSTVSYDIDYTTQE